MQVTLSNSSSRRSSKLEKELNSFGQVNTSSLVTVSLELNIENKDYVETVYQGEDLFRRQPCEEPSFMNSKIVWIIVGATIGIIVIVIVVAVVTFICVRRRNRQWNWSHYEGKQLQGKGSQEVLREGQYLEEYLEQTPRDSRAVKLDPRMISSPLEPEYENAEDLVRGSAKPTWVNTSRHY